MKEKKFDVSTMFAEKIITAMEAAQATGENWLKPFSSAGIIGGAFHNVTTGNPYKGMNTLMCAFFGDGDIQFASYKQWQAMGCTLKQSAFDDKKGVQIVYYSTQEYESKKNPGEKVNIPFARYSTVYGISQVENPPLHLIHAPIEVSPEQRNALVDSYINNTGAVIKHNPGAAYYKPIGDYINIPPMSDFIENNREYHYYSTLLHELTHWTGSAPRLDRTKGKRFGDSDYAFEELIAEIGAAMQCRALGLSTEIRPDHAHYLNGWIKALKGDKRYIFEAAKYADSAVQYLDAMQHQQEALAA